MSGAARRLRIGRVRVARIAAGRSGAAGMCGLARRDSTMSLIQWRRGYGGRRAGREPRSRDRRRDSARPQARGRARDERPRRKRQDPRLPPWQGADAGPRVASRTGADLRRSCRQPYRRLVLDGARYDAPPPDHAARLRLRAADERRVRLELYGDGRGAADARDRRLDDARGAARRGDHPGGARRARALRVAGVGRRARARRPPGRAGDARRRRPRDPTGETQSDTVVELGAGQLVEEIEQALVGASAGETKPITYELADGGRPPSTSPSSRQREGAARGRRRAGARRERVRHAR